MKNLLIISFILLPHLGLCQIDTVNAFVEHTFNSKLCEGEDLENGHYKVYSPNIESGEAY